MRQIKRALVSVSDKSGLLELAGVLNEKGVEMFSTGGTLRALMEAGIPAKSVEGYTQFPEMLDGRVKTLHPKIYGGILARRDLPAHLDSLKTHSILEFDLVVVNLYPFEKVIQKENFSFEEAIENIDIGGPSMIRAAAKNFADVAVLVDPSQYDEFIRRFRENGGAVAKEFRYELSRAAYSRTSAYDAMISTYMNHLQSDFFPETMNHSFQKFSDLRYGENPHQKGAFYSLGGKESIPWKQLHGKELSYNNLLDMDAAIRVAMDFSSSVCAIFKHTNPCGIASGKSQKENLERAIATDPVSYFGGIAAFNDTLKAETAELLNKSFFEIVVAPSFEEKALESLKTKKNLRVIEVPDMASLKSNYLELKTSSFGILVQETDRKIIAKEDIRIVGKTPANEEDINQMLFGFQVVKYVKSNAIVFVKDGQTLGIGAGQMSRVDSIEFGIAKAKKAGLSLEGSYLASDAFFPFRDGVDLAIKAGVRGIIQSGGSIRDEESIAAADESNVIMAFTGVRHFRHG